MWTLVDANTSWSIRRGSAVGTPYAIFYDQGGIQRVDFHMPVQMAGQDINLNGNTLKSVNDLELDEITTPTAVANHGKVYTKADNKLYFQDGAGNEHEVVFV